MLDELAASGFPPRSDRIASRRAGSRLRCRARAPPLGPRRRACSGRVGVGDLAERGSGSAVSSGTGRQSIVGRQRATRSASPARARGRRPPQRDLANERPASVRRVGRQPPAAPSAAPAPARSPRTSTSSSRPRPTTSATPPTACSTWSATTAASCSARSVSGGDPAVREPSAGGRASSCGSRPGSCRRRWATSRTWATSSRAATAPWTSPKRFVSARKRIDGLTAARDQLLRQLGRGGDDRRAAEHPGAPRIVEARLAAAHEDLAKAQQRVPWCRSASRSPPTQRATSRAGRGRSATPSTTPGRVLTVTAGAALVGARGAAAVGAAGGARRRGLARLGAPSARPGARRRPTGLTRPATPRTARSRPCGRRRPGRTSRRDLSKGVPGGMPPSGSPSSGS